MTDVTSHQIIASPDAAPVDEDPLISKLREMKAHDEALSYSEAEKVGLLCQRNMDTGRWLIGDLAAFVETEYAEHTIEAFADGIHVDPDRVREYRTMARFWTFSARAEYSELEAVTYSHMRAAKGLKELEAAKSFLQECVLNEWTVRDARSEVQRRQGKHVSRKVYNAYMTVGHIYPDGSFVVMPGERADVQSGVLYHMVLRDVGDDS